MNFRKGDIVIIGDGKVHWEVLDPGDLFCVLVSGMTGRRRVTATSRLKYWNPGD